MSNDLRSTTVRLEIPIKANAEKVWHSLVTEIDLWWSKDFLVTNPKAFVLEARVGGRVFEDGGDGSGGVWFTVHTLIPNTRLRLVGHLFPEYGGPATTLLTIDLEEKGNETLLKLEDSLFGVLSEGAEADIEGGWKMLFDDGLRKHVESSR